MFLGECARLLQVAQLEFVLHFNSMNYSFGLVLYDVCRVYAKLLCTLCNCYNILML